MKGLRTLVLNADMSPISLFPLHTIPVEDAVTRCWNGTCFVVAEYDLPILTPTVKMNWPAVIARKEYTAKEMRTVLRRETLFYRDHGVCAYCGAPLVIPTTTVDHVLPKGNGGQHKWENVVASCAKCNQEKSDSMPVGKWKPKVRPYNPSYWNLLRARKKFPITVDHESWIDYLTGWEGDVKIRA